MRNGFSSRVWLAIAATTVTAAMAFAPSALAGTAGTSAWRVSNATDAGAYSASQMSVTLALAERNQSALNALIAKPHAALTPAQFAAQFSPSTATVDAIRGWAAAHSLTVSSVSANRLLVTLSGSSSQLSSALQTGFERFHSAANGTFFAASKAAHLPASFASDVTAVLGLSSLSKVALPKPSVRSAAALSAGKAAFPAAGLPTSLNYPATYTPQQLNAMYDAPSAQTGAGQQLAIMTEGDVSQPKADLATFEKTYGLPAVTWNQINVGAPSTDTSGDDEWDLDSQYSTAFAPGVTTLNVYVGPSLNDDDILTTINKWVSDDIAKQGSFSAGECDILADASGFTTGLDAVLKQADAQGQTMFFSSGDTGSQCPAVIGVNGVPAGIPDTNYPASSPYGIGVGGTSVLNNNPLSEIAWYAGGGGLSPVEPAASFQANAKVLGVAAPPTRGVPDVSLDADPESGYDVVVSGTVEGIGGTSASAPSWQGIWARVNGADAGLGFAGPVLYSTEPSSAFNDITIGANGAYTAGPGYDLVTGLGTPDIAKLVNGA
ncbi:MAG TPA: S53 family peptidase [Solirubrobacteraceae bacterium]|jgi:subtilase family serine protease|nr:S53 family peptidase [Solirubrobacteraceae bacterium]